MLIQHVNECWLNLFFFLIFPTSTLDVNECDAGNAGCQSQCCNTIGSFYCKCPEGSKLKEDGKTCEGTNPTGWLLWINFGVSFLDIVGSASVGWLGIYIQPKKIANGFLHYVEPLTTPLSSLHKGYS